MIVARIPMGLTTVRYLATVILIALCSLQTLGQTSETVGLWEAMLQARVVTTFTATGASSGDSITLTIRKTFSGPGTLNITVPSGLRLHNTNAAWQSMVVSGVRGRLLDGNRYIPESVITLSEAAPSATYVLSAYCAEFHKDNPSSNSLFLVEAPDSTTSCILSNANSQGLSTAATQAAEWINTDRVTFNDLQAKFPVSLEEWNSAVQIVSQCQKTFEFHPQAQLASPSSQYAIAPLPPTNTRFRFRVRHYSGAHGMVSDLGGIDGWLTIDRDRVGFETGKVSDTFDLPWAEIDHVAGGDMISAFHGNVPSVRVFFKRKVNNHGDYWFLMREEHGDLVQERDAIVNAVNTTRGVP
jgi:hypothetical protein